MMSSVLHQLNELLTAAVLIVSFSLLAYVALHNWRRTTARALCMLLLCVVIVYGGDILIERAELPGTIQFLLRAQWLGIALVPPAYMHLSHALRTMNQAYQTSRLQSWLKWSGYIISVLLFLFALHTDLVVQGGVTGQILVQFEAGPLFWLYVAFFAISIAASFHAIQQTQHQALTPTLRRRMNYLKATFVAPGLGVFPFMMIAGEYPPFSYTMSLILLVWLNIAIVSMITVMTYSVGFQGVPMPDRLIKQDFTRWGLYGPVVGVTIILCIQIVPWLDQLLGLPSDTLITFVVMMMTVVMPLLISRVRPYLDALVYMQDQEEIDYLRAIPRNVFTGTDLRQLLENTLIAVCGALHVETGFVAGQGKEGQFTIKALCGSRRLVKRFVAEHPINEIMPQVETCSPRETQTLYVESFVCVDGFSLLPLHSPDGKFLGALGVAASPSTMLTNGTVQAEALHLIDMLTHHIELAITTVQMQQRLFDTLRGMDPEVKSLQQLTAQLEQATPSSLSTMEEEVSLHPEFPQLVKDALSHYWGGPKLSDSPLLELRSVRRSLKQEGGSATRALQAVLRQAITNMRPDEQLDPSAQEWLLYNILEMRFLQGKRIRDVANRLAMSESDYYRKQRVAVEEVARQLALMEDGEKTK